MKYDSNYEIAKEISRVIGNPELPYDSCYSICLEIYKKLSEGTIPSESDIFVIDNTNDAAESNSQPYRNFIPVMWDNVTSDAIKELGCDNMFSLYRLATTGSGNNKRFAAAYTMQFDREIPIENFFKYYNKQLFPEQEKDMSIRNLIKFVGSDFTYYDYIYRALNRSHSGMDADTRLVDAAYAAYPNAAKVLQDGHFYSTKVVTYQDMVDSIEWYYNPYGYIDEEGVYTQTSESSSMLYDTFTDVECTGTIILYFDEGTDYDAYVQRHYFTFDSVYSILLAILPLVEEGGGEVEQLRELISLLNTDEGIIAKSSNTNRMVVMVEPKNNDSTVTYNNIRGVVWGDGTYTLTDGTNITGGDEENTTIGKSAQNLTCLTHNYSATGNYTVKLIGTKFNDSFDTDNGWSPCITSIHILKGVEHISALIYGQPVQHFTFDDECRTSIARYGIGYGTAVIDTIYFPAGITFSRDYECYNTYINNFRFAGNNAVTTLPIGFNYVAKTDGSAATELVFPPNLITISNYAYAVQSPYIHSNIRHLVIPNTVTTIGDAAFGYKVGDNGLIDIPSSVTSIGAVAFRRHYGDVSGRATYTVLCRRTTPPACMRDSFGGVDNELPTACTLYVPSESLELYKAATGWKEFGTILPLEQYYVDVATNAEIDLIFN